MSKPNVPSIHRTPIGYHTDSAQTSWNVYPGMGKWMLVAQIRRFIAFIAVTGSAVFATLMMYVILAGSQMSLIKWCMLAVFSLLFVWLSTNFWVSVFGFLASCHRDRFKPSRRCSVKDSSGFSDVRIAVVMPIYNEDVPAIFARIQSMHKSLHEAGGDQSFHFFILSDTQDSQIWHEEEAAWAVLSETPGDCRNIFYRRRKTRINKKHGNIMDFCRRWGCDYKYMIVLDSDSLMSGEAFMKLVHIMEISPDIGMLQTAPKLINQRTPFARAEQFANHFYGPLYTAGLNFLQMGDAAFWGHNAIIRLEPFMRYCALPILSGRPPFGGEILSHDFIEAAFMRRAGFGVWMALDLQDSYEESPANLLEALKRDRRWCLGNIQHLRFLWEPGLSWGHRMFLLNGNLYYMSALLWTLLLVLSTVNGIIAHIQGPVYFSTMQKTLFPTWPIQHRGLSLLLLGMTLVFLLGSKFLSFIMVCLVWKKAIQFGGVTRIIVGIFSETVFSVFIAPVKMLFQTSLILKGLSFGQSESWQVHRTTWKGIDVRTAGKAMWALTLIGLFWSGAIWIIDRTVFWWLLIVLIPLIFSVPFTVLSGHLGLGDFLKQKRIFLTPTELEPPKESQWVQNYEKLIRDE